MSQTLGSLDIATCTPDEVEQICNTGIGSFQQRCAAKIESKKMAEGICGKIALGESSMTGMSQDLKEIGVMCSQYDLLDVCAEGPGSTAQRCLNKVGDDLWRGICRKIAYKEATFESMSQTLKETAEAGLDKKNVVCSPDEIKSRCR